MDPRQVRYCGSKISEPADTTMETVRDETDEKKKGKRIQTTRRKQINIKQQHTGRGLWGDATWPDAHGVGVPEAGWWHF